MSERDLAAARRQQILKIVAPFLDGATMAIIESALAGDERMAVIRDAFLEGRDHEAVHMIRSLDPIGRWGILPCGTGLTPIAPGQSAQITARPQGGDFDPRYLLVSRACADFMLNDIRVMNRSQFLQSGDVPLDPFVVDSPSLELFDPPPRSTVVGDEPAPADEWKIIRIDRMGSQLLGVRLDIETVHRGDDIVLVVTNEGTTDVPFRAAWIGQEALVRAPGDPSVR